MRVSRTRGLLAIGAAAMLVFGAAATASADEDLGSLPGGTAITVSIDDPADGEVFVIPQGDTTLAIDVHGTATVGEGVPEQDTTVVYVMDVSGSMTLGAGVDCDGVPGNDSRFVCEKEAIAAANTAAADAGSSVDLTGLAVYASAAEARDVDRSGAVSLLVRPDYDGDSNSTPDLEDVARGEAASGATNYAAGLTAAVSIVNDGANTNSVNLVIFLSDGVNNAGANVNTVVIPAATTILSYAIGTGATCASDPIGRGSLDDVAGLSTAGTGTCTEVTDPSDLADAITESIGSTLDSLQIEVDSGGTAPIGNTEIVPDLPQDGPASVDYWTTTAALSAGTHEICVTANGTDAGGSGFVTDCHTIELVQEVAIDIKPGSFPNSINVNKKKGVIPVAILGSDTFDVTNIDVTTLEFAGATPSHDLSDPYVYADHLQDVNYDGYVDLVSHYSTPETNLVPGDTEACITGDFNGASFIGCDSVRTVPSS